MIEVTADRALWQRYISGGDEQALIDLFQRKHGVLHRLAVQVTGNAADADDAIQAALAHLIEHEPQHAVQSVQPWLMGVVLNQARSIVRREVRLRNRHQRGQAVDEQEIATPDQMYEQQEMHELLNAALSELPEHYREPLVLHYMEGMKFKDIADVLERKEETVKKQSQRAIKMMRQKMTQRGMSLGALAFIALLEGVHAQEHDCAFTYTESGSAAVPLPAWFEPFMVSVSAAAVLCVMYFLFMQQRAEPVSVQPIVAQVEQSEEITLIDQEPLAQVKPKPWQQAQFKHVMACPFGLLEQHQATKDDLSSERPIDGTLILEDHYWRFRPKGKMPTMFETRQLKLPRQYHMQFEFKIQALEKPLAMKQEVYFGFLFNRTGRKDNMKGILKPLPAVTQRLHADPGTWHTVDIEVQNVDEDGSKMRDVIYSIDGERYWRVETSLPSRDIIPIGVNNISVIMRNFVYFDLDAIN